ncbi:MAG: A/G-specific adenine glycosylase [Holophagae bacterium]|jgi:A/G-specific adenine glycosylase
MTTACRLLTWFRANARALPWRTAPRDPYRTLVSELMLQQTQVDRVVPRFEAFIGRFPTLEALADAPETAVLEAWSGLGYYRRARLLHRLAREVAATGGELPRTARELEQLPGVGPYTAAAMASMVFGERVPLMDGNVARVGARVLALADDPRRRRGRQAVIAWVSGLISSAPPGEINEALMELGARVCTPTAPRCDACPLADDCRALDASGPEAYPSPRRSRPPLELCWIAVIAEDSDGRWLLRRVSDGPILRGLWLPPIDEIDEPSRSDARAAGLLPFDVRGPIERLEPVRHSITHRRIEVTPLRVMVGDAPAVTGGWRWADPRSPGLPTSSLLAKLVRAVD